MPMPDIDLAHRPQVVPGGSVSLGLVVERVVGELSDLAHLTDRLQDALSEIVADGGAPSIGSSVRELQNLDMLGQRLIALSSFLDALRPTLSAKWIVDPGPATKILTLAEVARRLSGTEAPHDEDDNGECELF